MQENPRRGTPRPGSAAGGDSGWGRFAARSGFVLLAVLVGLAGRRVGGLLASSLLVAAPAAAIGLALGLVVALGVAKSRAPGRRVALAAVSALVLLPLHLVATGWLAALGDLGWLSQWLAGSGPSRGWLIGYPGAIALHALYAAPWAALLATAALAAVDSRREEQALLDAGPLSVLWRVTLREAAPALAAIGALLAVLAATEIAATDLLGVRTFAEEVYIQAAAGQLTGPAEGGGRLRLAAGVGALGLVAAAALGVLALRLAPLVETPHTKPWRLSRRESWPLGVATWLLTGLLLIAPIASLIITAGVGVEIIDEQPERRWSLAKAVQTVAAAPWQHRRELGVSLRLACAVATGATLLGGAIAWRLRRGGALGAIGCVLLAIAVAIPGPVVGVWVIRLLNQPLDSPLAWLGELYGTWFAPWLAQTLRITPALALLLWPAAARVADDLLDAARTDGAGPLGRVLRVTGPLCLPALVAAWCVGFALSLGELSATVLVVPPGTPPLSVRLLSLLHYGVEDRVAAIGLVLVAAALLISGVVIRLLPARGKLG
ncbi:putrescine transporter subunit: membrane component of ABC superfamily protein [Planctomycetes bacterium MalM25]|nr:putrescine transporter subunit: membrane component of ABC superfamily protein [Planctomycetes bacterium MalM25]